MSIILRILFSQSKHPITAIILITSQTTLTCLILFFIISINWFSIILFLIFMGGLIVLFIYISSLASNEKFKISIKNIFINKNIIILCLFIRLIYINTQYFTTTPNITKPYIFYIYSNNIINPTFILITYLLVTLIISVNIIKLHTAPMRSSINYDKLTIHPPSY